MSVDESLDVTRIYSVADALPEGIHLIKNRPFRAPHHTISNAGLVGGGNWPHPGEISLAHRGVSFWMNCLNSAAAHLKCCASRLKTRSSPSAAPRAP
jgi:predicted ATPase with chaperone activity